MPEWLTAELSAELARGVAVTVVLTIVTSLGAFAVGLAAAIARRSDKRPVRMAATTFVETFRNVPALILLIFFAFAVPNLFSPDLRRTLFFANPLVDLAKTLTTLTLPYYAFAAAFALILNTGAHLSEVIRPGMDAVPASRIEVARSLGASARTVHRTVVIPDGLRVAFPAIVNRLVHNLKNTALVSFVAVPDLYQEIQAAITATFRATPLLVMAAVLYLALATVLEFGLGRIERALWRGRPIDRTLDV
jgi:His/Glu/Gln/Arg/opine family amino acid ABC transporter permease subunit